MKTTTPHGDEAERLTEAEIEQTLEAGVRRGSVQATLALLRLRESRQKPVPDGERESAEALPRGHPLRYTTLDDPFLALDPSELAFLSDEQRAQVRAIHAQGDKAQVVDCCLGWAEWLRANLEPPYLVNWRTLPEGVGP
jgi:hypothetical protein